MASTIVGALRVILTADTAEFKSGLDEAAKGTTAFSGKLSGVATQIGGFSRLFGTLFPIAVIGAAAKQVVDYASKIEDLSAQTGLTTETLQQMGHVAKLTGTSLEAFTNAAFKLGTNLAGGSNSVVAAAEQLGLSWSSLMALSPDEQFNQIAAALSKVEDEQTRNKLAVDLFGRSAKQILPAIAAGYEELARGAQTAGEDQIKAIDEAGDALDSLKNAVLSTATSIGGNLVIAIRDALKWTKEWVNSNFALTKGLESWAAIFEAAGMKSTALPKVLNESAAAAKNLPAPLRAVTMSLEEQERIGKKLDQQVKDSIKVNKEAIEARKDAEADRLEALKEAAALERSIVRENAQFKEQAVSAIETEQRAWRDYFNFLAERRMEDEASLLKWRETVSNPDWLTKMFVPLKAGVRAVSLETQKSFENIGEAFRNIGPAIIAAVQGGGGIAQSIGAVFGQAIGKDLAENLSGFLTRNLGKTIGAAFGSLLPGIGALLGPALGLIGGGLKKLFGIGINEEVKKANGEIGKLRDSLIKTHGSLDDLERKANAVGLSFRENWGHQGQAGLEAFNRLIEEFNRRWDALQQNLADTRGELDGLLGQARDLGYEFDQNGQFIGVSFDTLREKAREFGVDLNGLGPAMRQQALDAEAAKIINAFTLMSKAAGPEGTGGILVGLKDEIGKVVGDSIKFGTTIPRNMQPWIEELIRTDQLVDENGNKITDLSQLKFGDPIAAEFEKVANALLEVVDKLNQILSQIAAIPTNKTLTVTTVHQDVYRGGGDEPRDAGFAVGTMGRFGSWFKNFGPEFQTALHNVQAVITPEQSVPFAMDVLSGLGAPAVAGGGDFGEMTAQISGLRRDLVTTIPALAESAARHGAQTAGRTRR